MNDYAAKQAARRERLEARAGRKASESASRLTRAHAAADAIPMGQPILIGHHSEVKHRGHIARIERDTRAGYAAADEAADLARRAAAVGTAGISSDDPEAIAKLREALASVEADRARYAAENAAARKAKRDPPWAAYVLSNAGASARRISGRIADLEARAAEKTSEIAVPGARIVDDVEANRLQIFFDERPSPEVIADLQAGGFRWAPSVGAFGAWQRMRSVRAQYLARQITKGLARRA